MIKKLRLGGENILKRIVVQLSKDFDDIIIRCNQEDFPEINGVKGF
ncbi:MAG TPA: hypothetical protein VIK44_10765 [Acetobacterium sp.]